MLAAMRLPPVTMYYTSDTAICWQKLHKLDDMQAEIEPKCLI